MRTASTAYYLRELLLSTVIMAVIVQQDLSCTKNLKLSMSCVLFILYLPGFCCLQPQPLQLQCYPLRHHQPVKQCSAVSLQIVHSCVPEGRPMRQHFHSQKKPDIRTAGFLCLLTSQADHLSLSKLCFRKSVSNMSSFKAPTFGLKHTLSRHITLSDLYVRRLFKAGVLDRVQVACKYMRVSC